mgnify:CR=1 FL=1
MTVVTHRAIDIHKAAGVLLKDRKFLITRTKGKSFFISPGGKVETGESVKDALRRELSEELSIEVNIADLEKFGTFFAPAAGQDEKYLQMDVFLVRKWNGDIHPASEVEEARWINSTVPKSIELGAVFRHDVLPLLKEKNLID